MSHAARRAAMARKPPKRLDPPVNLADITITTSQWLRLMDMARSCGVTEQQLIRVAIAQLVKTVEPR